MLEVTIKIEAPDLATAISKLADAIAAGHAAVALDAAQAVLAEPVPPAAPSPAPAVSTAPKPVPETENTQSAPNPVMPTAAPGAYTQDQIARAGAALVDMGKMDALLALLGKYGIAAVTQLQPAQYGAFAAELRALGAQI